MFLLQKNDKKPCYLSQTAGLHRFFNTFLKIITPQPLRGSGFSTAKIRRKNEIRREFRRKSENFGENQRKTEKSSVNLRAYP